MNKWIQKWIKVYLKCYINLILYYRNVYPSESFHLTTYQSFNLPQFVPITRHPGLQGYIETLILDLINKLTHVYQISLLVIETESNICLERYYLDFSDFKHTSIDSDTDDDNEQPGLNENEVFDEFRSSLNSLINKLETLPKFKDDSVTFDIMINVVNMELGHGQGVGWNLATQEQLTKFENDTNWTKCHNEDDENYNNLIGEEPPTVKMISLVGCDLGPFVVHNYMEVLQLPKSPGEGPFNLTG